MAGFFYNMGRSVRAGVQKGKWIFQSITGSDEDVIKAEYDAGVEIAAEFEKESKLESDEPIIELLDEITNALAERTKNKLRKFSVKAVRMDEPNAFALPGGFIYITRSLIDLCASGDSFRDELAFILGHEMGHVVRGHAMQRMVNSTLVNTATKAVPIGGALGRMAVQAGSRFLSAAYSQDHEFEADAFGLKLSRAAGFDEQATVQMMQRLQTLAGDHPEDSLGAYFASHPPFKARIRELRKRMRGSDDATAK